MCSKYGFKECVQSTNIRTYTSSIRVAIVQTEYAVSARIMGSEMDCGIVYALIHYQECEEADAAAAAGW